MDCGLLFLAKKLTLGFGDISNTKTHGSQYLFFLISKLKLILSLLIFSKTYYQLTQYFSIKYFMSCKGGYKWDFPLLEKFWEKQYVYVRTYFTKFYPTNNE